MRVYTHYEDGRSWLSEDSIGSDTPIDIPMWQWQLYRVWRWADRHVSAWEKTIDNRAYEMALKRVEDAK